MAAGGKTSEKTQEKHWLNVIQLLEELLCTQAPQAAATLHGFVSDPKPPSRSSTGFSAECSLAYPVAEHKL